MVRDGAVSCIVIVLKYDRVGGEGTIPTILLVSAYILITLCYLHHNCFVIIVFEAAVRTIVSVSPFCYFCPTKYLRLPKMR